MRWRDELEALLPSWHVAALDCEVWKEKREAFASFKKNVNIM